MNTDLPISIFADTSNARLYILLSDSIRVQTLLYICFILCYSEKLSLFFKNTQKEEYDESGPNILVHHCY